MKTNIAFVLLADLHFGAGPLKQAELPPLALSGVLRKFGMRGDVEKFFAGRCAAHDLAVLKSLPRYLTKLLVKLRTREDFPGYEFDQMLLLGDLATWPSHAAYDFLRDYIATDNIRLTNNRTMAGLNTKPVNIVSIPG